MSPTAPPADDTAADAAETTPARAAASGVLGRVFIVLFVQMQVLLFFSLIDYQPVMFVQRFMPQLDLSDFLVATSDWLNGLDPYLRERFDKPPASMLVTLPLLHFSPAHAASVFFLANIVILAAALGAVCRHFRLSRTESLLLFGIASMYFPVIFLIERGNLDGIMLALILMAVFAKNPIVRALGLALSFSVKLYSGLLFVPLLIARKWRVAGFAAVLILLLLVPFHSLLLPFAHRQMGRTGEFHLTENVSPALYVEVFLNSHSSSLCYYGLWLLSYAAMLSRHRRAALEVQMLYSLPWMMALPIHVYAYTGVLLLPLLALRSTEIARVGRTTARDYTFLAGFLLVGFQQTAWLAYFHQSLLARVVGSLANATGTALVMGTLALGQRASPSESVAKSAAENAMA
jgi:hypothetical protein